MTSVVGKCLVIEVIITEDSNCSFHFIDDLSNAGITEKERVMLSSEHTHVHSDNWGPLIIWGRASGAAPQTGCMLLYPTLRLGCRV